MKAHSFGLMARSSAVALALAALVPTSQAWAQEDETLPAEPEASSSDQDEAIIVTGSRISRSTFTSTTPVTVIGSDTIEALGQVNIGETLQTIPQNVSTSSDAVSGLTSNTNNPNIGANVANLRGLNPQRGVRTLTLIDTRRHVPTAFDGAVDMNIVPSVLVQSIETVTGGASAAYGTDALVGVVNVLLDKQLEGIKGQIDYGQTFRSDGSDFHAALGGGTSFADGRGHIMAGVEYQDKGEIGDCVYVRQWCAESPNVLQNDNWLANGEPHYIRSDDVFYTNYNLTGVLRGSRGFRTNPFILRNITFTPNGDRAIDFDEGEYTIDIGFGNRLGGTCTIDCSYWSELQLRPSVERLSTFAHAEYEVSDSVTAWVEGSYANRKSNIKGLSLGPSSGHPLRADNAFIQNVPYFDRLSGTETTLGAVIQAALADPTGSSATATNVSQAPGVSELPIFVAKHMVFDDGARNDFKTDLDTWSAAAGLDGEFNLFGNRWNWDAYYQYGKTKQFLSIGGIRINEYLTSALDAVDEGMMQTMQQDINGNWIPFSGTPNGNIVCRGTLLGPGPNPVPTENTSTPAGWFAHWNRPEAAGCVPFDPTKQVQDQAVIDYIYRTATQDFTYEQHVFAFNLSGDIYEGWAGPIALALGGEYRYEDGAAVHNKTEFGEFSIDAFGNDLGGSLEILEGYVETNIPLLSDVPMVEYLELNAAYRHTEQTNTDATTGGSKDLSFDTWKISGNWEVTDWLRLRATRSRDVRAASFVDLYYNLGKTEAGPPTGRANNPWHLSAQGDALEDFADILYNANFGLRPEVGNTWTAGAVLQPGGALDGLRLSVDYYNIEISDAIVVLTAQQVVDACFNAGIACENITTGLDGGGVQYDTVAGANPPEINGGTGFQSIQRGGANIGAFTQSGWDIELQYRLPLRKLGENIPGVLTWRGMATITDEMVVNLGDGAELDYRNQTGGSGYGGFAAPSKYILQSYLTYENGGFSMTIDNRYIPEGIYDIRRCDVSAGECDASDSASINYNTVDSRLYTGLSASYEFGLAGSATAELFLSIRNLFDVDPPEAPSNATGGLGPVAGYNNPTNPVFYDTFGARWRTGLRVNF